MRTRDIKTKFTSQQEVQAKNDLIAKSSHDDNVMFINKLFNCQLYCSHTYDRHTFSADSFEALYSCCTYGGPFLPGYFSHSSTLMAVTAAPVSTRHLTGMLCNIAKIIMLQPPVKVGLHASVKAMAVQVVSG